MRRAEATRQTKRGGGIRSPVLAYADRHMMELAGALRLGRSALRQVRQTYVAPVCLDAETTRQ